MMLSTVLRSHPSLPAFSILKCPLLFLRSSTLYLNPSLRTFASTNKLNSPETLTSPEREEMKFSSFLKDKDKKYVLEKPKAPDAPEAKPFIPKPEVTSILNKKTNYVFSIPD